MNSWTEKSVKIANSPGYLDKLSEVYKMKVNQVRVIKPEIILKIKDAYENRDSESLISLLIKYVKVFPVKDSYVGFLRKSPESLSQNSQTVNRIADRLYGLGFEKMMEEATRPKETNRQLGNAFRNWLFNVGYDVVSEDRFLESTSGIKILNGSDKSLRVFAEDKLGCSLRKGIDLVVKKDADYIIGEAKFLTTPGGEQDRGFDDAENFITDGSGDTIRIAILDGYVWIESAKGLYEKIISSNRNIMSALLLVEFMESL